MIYSLFFLYLSQRFFALWRILCRACSDPLNPYPRSELELMRKANHRVDPRQSQDPNPVFAKIAKTWWGTRCIHLT